MFDEEKQLRPNHRLITQNLVSSACCVEKGGQANWNSVRDLSILIDLYCLYDKLVVLGRGAGSWIESLDSPILDLMYRANHFLVESPEFEDASDVSLAARGHLAAFLGAGEIDRFRSIVDHAINPNDIGYALSGMPDGHEEIALGREWLTDSPSDRDLLEGLKNEADVARATTFLVRSFVYLGYCNVSRLVFTPDSYRAPVLNVVMQKENELRGALMTQLREGWEEHPRFFNLKYLKRMISPLAAVVFQRAYPDRNQIGKELRELREELSDLRMRLRESEEVLLWGSGHEPHGAEQKWTDAIEELGRSFGTDRYLITTKGAFDMAKPIAGIIDKPASAKAWAEFLDAQPREVVTRYLNRQPTVELHDLRRELPAAEWLRLMVLRLFGTS